jgi:hypothetical protein
MPRRLQAGYAQEATLITKLRYGKRQEGYGSVPF